MANALLDALKTVLLPGDISTTTVSDLPVDTSPRYVVEQEIIPFRSVRSPLLTPIRDVQPVLRTPIKDFAPVSGRIRNIPSLPGQEGSRMLPYGDPDMRTTGFSGLTPTINRSFGAVGLGQGDSFPSPIPIEGTRIMQCVGSSFSEKQCGACCDRSFKNNPSKRHRCKNRCSAKHYKPIIPPLPPSGLPSASSQGSLPSSSFLGLGGRYYSDGKRSIWQKGGFGYSPGAWLLATNPLVASAQPYVESQWQQLVGDGGGAPSGGQCSNWFQNPKAGCQTDMVKIGLIAAAIFLVTMK